MPRMDGYTATSKLRESGYAKPIIAITGNSQESEVMKCHDSGYTDVLIKPVQLNTLTATILRWVPDNQDPSDSVPGNVSASRISSTNSIGSMGDESMPNMSDV
jgi:two-component system sensor kinase